MIAFLHTSAIHIPKFENLVRTFDAEVEIKHFVNEDILSSALEKGVTDTVNFSNEITKIKALQPKLIICTCSTYGEECDNNAAVERIDQPIAEFLVTNFTKIGLAYTANSTKEVSHNLLVRIAKEKNKEIDLIHCDCSSAWTYYEQNDFNSYSKTIAQTIISFENEVEVVFLAQASMEGAKEYLTSFSKEIYSSPEFGVQKYLKK
ncbi:hypothetical protein [Flavicella sediminum]|uniref:hypothetical protein n=1 Tax=Flavicella sediminum TaxID=2585141 RepID=UPI0011200932|nr:hypothetical protein [Flavicella sediminum]